MGSLSVLCIGSKSFILWHGSEEFESMMTRYNRVSSRPKNHDCIRCCRFCLNPGLSIYFHLTLSHIGYPRVQNDKIVSSHCCVVDSKSSCQKLVYQDA